MTGRSTAASVSVLIADDQPLIRTALTALLDHEPDMTVAGQATDGAEAVALVRELLPDVVLMDIRMPGMDGIEATRLIREQTELDGVRVLVLTTFEDEDTVAAALRAGASGFIGKGGDPADLVNAIRTIHAGDSLLSPAATRALIERFVLARPAAGEVPAALAGLTERELGVLTEVARGLANEQIAADLGISTTTVKTHVNRTMAKLKVHDRAQLVVLAYSSGLVN